jgi:DNA-3-methyladenine glycosylase II
MTGNPKTIENERDVAAGIRALIRADVRFQRVYKVTGQPPLRRRDSGFEALLRIITDQQISLHAGEAIWSRFAKTVGSVRPETIVAKSEADLLAVGQSRAKVRTIRAVSRAVLDGSLDLDRLERLDDEAAACELMSIKGIGPWTADIYLLSCLGRPDVWPAGDVALQTGAQLALGLETRPNTRELSELAQAWRPWRAVAARLLWAYYRHERM